MIRDNQIRVAWNAWLANRGGSERIQALNQARLSGLVAHARAHSPLLSSLYRDLPPQIEDIRLLPPVTKTMVMAHFDDWVTDPTVKEEHVRTFIADLDKIGHLFRDRYTVFTTSGSTGTPVIILHDVAAWSTYKQLGDLRTLPFLVRLGIRPFLKVSGGLPIAAVYSTGGHFAGCGGFEYTRQQNPRRSEQMRLISVLRPIAEIVAELNAFQPGMLMGYATILGLLAEERDAGRLEIEPIVIYSSGETLFPGDKVRIESAFRCKVMDVYSATEAPGLTFPCHAGRMHLHGDWFILEPVDEQDNPVRPGVASHTVLVTNLVNRIQPIIRYRMGDKITFYPDSCPCGSKFPSLQVEGRTNEVLSFRSTDGSVVRVLPLALATIVEETRGVYQYQLIQRAPDCLELRLEVSSWQNSQEVEQAIERRLGDYLHGLGIDHLTILRSADRPARNPQTGKMRQVWAEMDDAVSPAGL